MNFIASRWSEPSLCVLCGGTISVLPNARLKASQWRKYVSGDDPINDVTKMDLLSERRDGGLDLEILVTGPLDSSPRTLELLETKVRNYIREALDEEFRSGFEYLDLGNISIRLVSSHEISVPAAELIGRLASEARAAGLKFVVLGEGET